MDQAKEEEMGTGLRTKRMVALLSLIVFSGCGTADEGVNASRSGGLLAAVGDRPSGGNDLFGPYRVVEGWQKPMPAPDLASGWTWGSFGGVFVENEDRIWMAMRGVLPLPEGAAPWTPWSMLSPSRGNAPSNSDGLGATCQPATPVGIERDYRFVIHAVDRDGNVVEAWHHHDDLFDHPSRCGRGPHKIKMSPYDEDRHRRSASHDLPIHE